MSFLFFKYLWWVVYISTTIFWHATVAFSDVHTVNFIHPRIIYDIMSNKKLSSPHHIRYHICRHNYHIYTTPPWSISCHTYQLSIAWSQPIRSVEEVATPDPASSQCNTSSSSSQWSYINTMKRNASPCTTVTTDHCYRVAANTSILTPSTD